MNSFNVLEREAQRSIRLAAISVMLIIVSMAVLSQPAYAAKITPPPVPENIQVPEGHVPFLLGHAEGTQNYICLPSENGVAFKLFTPQATLFEVKGKADGKGKKEQIATHFFSPNPSENGAVRAAWQDSEDTSIVWAKVEPGNSSSDPNFVEAGAIPWLLLTMAGTHEGPTGGDTLSETTFIQRLKTTGGVAPATGCSSTTDIGNQASVPYTADYIFYRSSDGK